MTATQWLPFVPRWLTAGDEKAVPATMRPFGRSPGDLDLDFRFASRPELTTHLLALCCLAADGGPVDLRLLLDLPIGMRIEALIDLAALADDRPFTWRMRCGSAACGKESEFDLTIPWLREKVVAPAAAGRDKRTITITVGQSEAAVRRPAGLDQVGWLKSAGGLESETMLRTILVRPGLDALLARGETLESIEWALDEAMDRFDPLPGFHLGVACPECSAATEVFPDLAGAALERLFQAQQMAIENVHRLASRYHWSERQIVELPEWRRQSYLQLLEQEGLQ